MYFGALSVRQEGNKTTRHPLRVIGAATSKKSNEASPSSRKPKTHRTNTSNKYVEKDPKQERTTYTIVQPDTHKNKQKQKHKQNLKPKTKHTHQKHTKKKANKKTSKKTERESTQS